MVDYFSKLPHPLIHHILSFLPFDDVARTCTLSQDWHRIWLSYPNVKFHFDFCAYKGQDFFDHIQNSLAECFVRKACIQNFSLSICFPEIEILTPNLDRWLNLAMKKNISELRLSIGRFYGYIYSSLVLYSIPGKVLVANTLEVLDLHQCNLKEDRFGYINLPCLGKLSLNKFQFVGESLLQKIVSACPIVEHISILRCIGVGHFLFVSCKPELKYFKVDRCEPELEKIEIDAPNLHTLSYNSSYKVCAIEMSIWSSVKELELGHAMVMQLEYLLSKFLCIELLKLSHGPSDKIKISSQSIKVLVFGFFFQFPGATIEAPALHTLEFSSTMSFSSEIKFSYWNVPKLDDIDMIFSVDNFSKACKAGLKEFLMKLHNYEDLRVVIFNNDNFVMVEKLHAVSSSFLRNMMLGKPVIKVAATIYMMCSSPENAESFYKKLGDHSIIKDKYRLLELVSPEEVEQQMNSALIEFVKSNSRVFNHHAAIILHKRTLADLIRRLGRRFDFYNRH
nr:putative F-box/LRR-repeat protein At4g15060 [Ipomoea batatas]